MTILAGGGGGVHCHLDHLILSAVVLTASNLHGKLYLTTSDHISWGGPLSSGSSDSLSSSTNSFKSVHGKPYLTTSDHIGGGLLLSGSSDSLSSSTNSFKSV